MHHYIGQLRDCIVTMIMQIKIINGITFFRGGPSMQLHSIFRNGILPLLSFGLGCLVLFFDLRFVCGRHRLSMSYQT